MSKVEIIIPERKTSIGNFLVGRLLPYRLKRMVGPFIYIDHMGPALLDGHHSLDVLPHPHIGLSTLTYLFRGSIMHRDSLGNALEIMPGQVNWMTAGRGIVHSERTPDYMRKQPHELHGLQIWVALPRHLEQMNPEFFHIDEKMIPCWEYRGIIYKLIAGRLAGRQSGVPVHSNLYFLEIKCSLAQTVSFGNELYGETGIYILEGEIVADNQNFGAGQMLVCSEPTMCNFDVASGTTLYIFGGEPFPEPRYIDWNFVSSHRDLLKNAKEKWINRTFGTIPGESAEYVPYPVRELE